MSAIERRAEATGLTQQLASEICSTGRSLFDLTKAEYEGVRAANAAYAVAWKDYVDLGGKRRHAALEAAAASVRRARRIAETSTEKAA